jgi:hypothetical protein
LPERERFGVFSRSLEFTDLCHDCRRLVALCERGRTEERERGQYSRRNQASADFAIDCHDLVPTFLLKLPPQSVGEFATTAKALELGALPTNWGLRPRSRLQRSNHLVGIGRLFGTRLRGGWQLVGVTPSGTGNLPVNHVVPFDHCTDYGVTSAVAPCGHLGLFMGRTVLSTVWNDIAHWLMQSA